MIIDAIRENKKRFAEWAEEWVTVPPQHFFVNGLICHEELIIEFLIEKSVFTVSELKSEFKKHRIYGYDRFLKKYAKNKGET